MWQYDLSLWALLGACAYMSAEDIVRRRFFGPLYPLALALSFPFLAAQGAAGLLVFAYSVGMVAAGAALARVGAWGSGDALALGVVGLQPLVFVFAAAVTAAGALGWRLRRGPPPSAFARFWDLAAGRPDRGFPYAAALGLAAAPFLALAILAAP